MAISYKLDLNTILGTLKALLMYNNIFEDCLYVMDNFKQFLICYLLRFTTMRCPRHVTVGHTYINYQPTTRPTAFLFGYHLSYNLNIYKLSK